MAWAERNKLSYSPNSVIEIYSTIYFCSTEHLSSTTPEQKHHIAFAFFVIQCALGPAIWCGRTNKNLHVIRRTQYYITHNLTKWSFIDTSVLEDHLSFPCSAFLLVVFFASSPPTLRRPSPWLDNIYVQALWGGEKNTHKLIIITMKFLYQNGTL